MSGKAGVVQDVGLILIKECRGEGLEGRSSPNKPLYLQGHLQAALLSRKKHTWPSERAVHSVPQGFDFAKDKVVDR